MHLEQAREDARRVCEAGESSRRCFVHERAHHQRARPRDGFDRVPDPPEERGRVQVLRHPPGHGHRHHGGVLRQRQGVRGRRQDQARAQREDHAAVRGQVRRRRHVQEVRAGHPGQGTCGGPEREENHQGSRRDRQELRRDPRRGFRRVSQKARAGLEPPGANLPRAALPRLFVLRVRHVRRARSHHGAAHAAQWGRMGG